MDYKEKLKLAKEALESGSYDRETIEYIFPEFKESEDEQSRKWILEYLYDGLRRSDEQFKGQFKCAIAWLEKQELKEIEQKSYGQRKECLDYQFNYAGKGFVAVDNCGDKTIYNPTGRRVAFFQKKPVRDLLTDNHYWATHISPYDVIHLGYKDFPKLKWEDEPIEVKIIISTDSYCQENCKGFQETSKCFADGDCEAKREAESVDKVEPKFHEGDWITNGNYTWKIVEVEPLNYILQSQDGNIVDDTISYVDERFHSFTIEDAKDGDVIVDKSDGVIGIFQSIGHHPDGGSFNDPSYCFLHCRYDDGYFYADFEHGNTIDSDDLIPASKEQRDTLERAMADAGYTFNFESKELKELSQSEVTKMSDQEEVVEIPFGAKDSELQEATYYIPKGFHAEIDDDKVVIKKGEKPIAWSEEDEEYLRRAINATKDTYPMTAKWLKSLKQRIGG